MYPNLFSPLPMAGIQLRNRLIMAPTYLGYAGSDGTPSPLLLDHYRLMAASGVAMVVVDDHRPPAARNGRCGSTRMPACRWS